MGFSYVRSEVHIAHEDDAKSVESFWQTRQAKADLLSDRNVRRDQETIYRNGSAYPRHSEQSLSKKSSTVQELGSLQQLSHYSGRDHRVTDQGFAWYGRCPQLRSGAGLSAKACNKYHSRGVRAKRSAGKLPHTDLAGPIVGPIVGLFSQIHYVDVGSEPDVIGEIPTDVIGIVIDDDVV